MSAILEIYSNETDDFTVVEVNGEVDIYTTKDFKKQLYNIIENSNKNIKIDFKNLTYIDSSGLGILVGALKKLKKDNRELFLMNLKSNILKLFSITNLDKVFIIEE